MATLKYKTPEGEWKKVSIGGGGRSMIALLLLFLLTSCSMSEVLETPLPRTKADTTYHPRAVDTLAVSDVPIGFDVSVDEWEDTNTEFEL